jgi:hypothetical protein
MTTVTINSNTYSDDGSEAKDMLNGGHRLHFFPLVSDVVTVAGQVAANAAQAAIDAASAANSAAAVKGTSTTSTAVGAGAKSLTTQASKQFSVGNWVTVTRTSDSAIKMVGSVTAYNAGTGALVVDVISKTGSGTFTDWSIALSGPAGEQGLTGDGSITHKSISSASTLTLADKAHFIQLSGTFTLSIASAASLGATWATKIKNVGTGQITIAPNGAELINGNTSKIIYPGASYDLLCDGTGLLTTAEPIVRLPVFDAADLNPVAGTSTPFNSSADLGSTAYDRVAANGSNFVASAVSASIVSAYSSPDGIVWTARTLPAVGGWNIVSDGTTFLGFKISTAETIYSASGISYAAATATPAAMLNTTACAVPGIYLVRSSATPTSIYRSVDDGTTWSTQTHPDAGAGSGAILYAHGSTFLAHDGGETSYYTSATGLTGSWTTRTMPGATDKITTCGSGFFAYTAAASDCYYSIDGINWTELVVPAADYVVPYNMINGVFLYRNGAGDKHTLHAGGAAARGDVTLVSGSSTASKGDKHCHIFDGIAGLIDATATDAAMAFFNSDE